MARYSSSHFAFALAFLAAAPLQAAVNVSLADVPDYSWHAGCFGTAAGNLMGYWDRHGLTNLYSGPTAGGVAPLTSNGANAGIRSLWASQAGFDGRPANLPGHIDDYWEFFSIFSYSYESTAADPYTLEGRPEHAPDCLGDFMGQSQRKFSDLNGECSGNIDAFAFTYWDKSGDPLVNFQPPVVDGVQVREIPSGLRAFSQYRGYEATVMAQLADFNPTISNGHGFTFENLKAEIDSGYPVLLILQNYNQLNRSLPGMPRANPLIHAMLAFGYVETDSGLQAVQYQTSWGEGPRFSAWNSSIWQAEMPLRGVITFHPQPRVTGVTRLNGQVEVHWEGPNSVRMDNSTEPPTPTAAHRYIVERADSLKSGNFVPVTEAAPGFEARFADSGGDKAFFRVRLVGAQ